MLADRPAAAFAAVLMSLAFTIPVLAAGPLEITSRVLVEHREPLPDGSVRLRQVPAAHAVPGDRVTVVVSYRNGGGVPLAGLSIDNPVPRGLAFRGSGSSRLEVSVDGTRFAPLSALTMPVPGGGARPARPDEVTAVRWRPSTPLAARSSGEFSFQAAIR